MTPDRSQALRNFLKAESLRLPITRHCPGCGSVMEYIVATFVTEADEVWDIPLPVCFKCVRAK
jgi:hypothetical protein